MESLTGIKKHKVMCSPNLFTGIVWSKCLDLIINTRSVASLFQLQELQNSVTHQIEFTAALCQSTLNGMQYWTRIRTVVIPQSHVQQANSEIMQIRGKKEERLGRRENRKITFYFARTSPSLLAALLLDPSCAHDLPFTTIQCLVLSHAHMLINCDSKEKINKELLAVFLGQTWYGEACVK